MKQSDVSQQRSFSRAGITQQQHTVGITNQLRDRKCLYQLRERFAFFEAETIQR